MTQLSASPSNGLRAPVLIALVCLIGTAVWVIASGSNLPGKPHPADRPVPPEDVLDFTTLYGAHCAACHGANGAFGPAPPLNDPLFRAIVPQKVLEQVISSGRRGTPMPGFDRTHGGRLTAAQIQVLAYQIKGVRYKVIGATDERPTGRNETKVVEDPGGVAPVWGPVGPAPSGAPPYLAPSQEAPHATEEAQARRLAVFERACAECHGGRGEGKRKHAGAIAKPEFLALASDQLLRRIMITGRPDLGMPNYASAKHRPTDFKPLESAEIDELVGLLGQWRSGASHSEK